MLHDKHLVPLKPDVFSDFACPACSGHDVRALGVVFPGVHVLGEYICDSCKLEFLRDLPIGFAVDHPLAIGRKDARLFNTTDARPWLYKPLLKAYGSPSDKEIGVGSMVHRACERAIILDTLDFLYGHVLLKLFNAQHYIDHYPDHGLILIVPRMFDWLVPEGVAEVWTVDIKLGESHGWYRAIDNFVQAQLPRFKEIHLARGYAHPDFSEVDIRRYSGVSAFPLNEFASRPPHITFVARTDRLWFATPFGKFCYRVLGAMGMKKSLGRWFIRRQDHLIAASMRRIRREVPDATFTVVGLAPPGGIGPLAEDLRTTRMNKATELQWCHAYAKSHVVIGVHGSNMLLPTAFAAGLVEILPHDRFGNMVQDVSVRYTGRMQLFLYRFVDEFASPRMIARHAVGMLKHFTPYHRNNQVNTFGNAL